MVDIHHIDPQDIERESFAIISRELAEMGVVLDPVNAPVIKRAIHTSADFDYAGNLKFSPGAVEAGLRAVRAGASIVTDTSMARSGISARTLESYGGKVYCFIGDADVAREAKTRRTTRSAVCMERAAEIGERGPVIVAVGNAPTALISLYELMQAGRIRPELVIGVPVGFVNVIESKELMMSQHISPYIVAAGRKGGSNVAAAICNALLYECRRQDGLDRI